MKVGGNVRIFDHDFHPLEWEARRPPENGEKTRAKAIEIGNDVFIGTNAIILKGSRIGDGSIVAAGSVVFGLDVPPNSLVKGNPAVIMAK
ncbi:MAG: acyltransferase [Kiritimatiellae bacterium]|nr:acyltransferase [Kiritimatiellia bacterium]